MTTKKDIFFCFKISIKEDDIVELGIDINRKKNLEINVTGRKLLEKGFR